MLTPFEIFLVIFGITLFVILLIWIISKCSNKNNHDGGFYFDFDWDIGGGRDSGGDGGCDGGSD